MIINTDVLNLNGNDAKAGYAKVAFEEPKLEYHEKIGYHILVYFFLIKQTTLGHGHNGHTNEIVYSCLSRNQEKKVRQYARKLAIAHFQSSKMRLSGKKSQLSQANQTNYFLFRVKKN